MSDPDYTPEYTPERPIRDFFHDDMTLFMGFFDNNNARALDYGFHTLAELWDENPIVTYVPAQ